MDTANEASNEVSTLVKSATRLRGVRATRLLDSETEASFDRLTRLAAKLTQAPVTFVSIVDEQRDFYKSCFGFPEPLASERELVGTTFCHYALSSDGPLVIEDALSDPVYRHVPTVQSLGVRAYLGVPLTLASGQTIGSFCAIDFQPRVWSELDIEVMRELALSTLREIELRMALAEISQERVRVQALADHHSSMYDDATNASRERERFFASVTHELRTPMTSILGWLQILREVVLNSVDATEALAMIEMSAKAQARLVNDLLDSTRVGAGKIALELAPVEAGEMIADAVRAAAPAALMLGIDLTTSRGDHAPLLADPKRLRQVLDNLIGNALKFTPSGGKVDVRSEVAGDVVHIRVSDTGRGIAPEMLGRLFERGVQVNSGEQGGLGLGLSISDAIAKSHGGTISVESAGIGRGSAFIVTLPLSARGG